MAKVNGKAMASQGTAQGKKTRLYEKWPIADTAYVKDRYDNYGETFEKIGKHFGVSVESVRGQYKKAVDLAADSDDLSEDAAPTNPKTSMAAGNLAGVKLPHVDQPGPSNNAGHGSNGMQLHSTAAGRINKGKKVQDATPDGKFQNKVHQMQSLLAQVNPLMAQMTQCADEIEDDYEAQFKRLEAQHGQIHVRYQHLEAQLALQAHHGNPMMAQQQVNGKGPNARQGRSFVLANTRRA